MTTYIAFCFPPDQADRFRHRHAARPALPIHWPRWGRDSDELLVTPAMAELAGTDATNAASVDALYAEYGQIDGLSR